MKQTLAIVGVAAGLAVSAATSQASLNFTGINDIQFNGSGSSFQLNPIAGSITSPQFSFSGADAGLTGWVSGGPWAVNMASLYTASVGSITYQEASVAGGGQLSIYDGSQTLTGNLSWLEIHTSSRGQGGLTDSLSVNLTSLAYGGVNPDLLALVAGKNGNFDLTFQFSGTDPNLQDLLNGTGTSTASYSGSISSSTSAAVPEPSTVVAGAMLLLPLGVSVARILRKNKQQTTA
jgi:hypothetical protein